MYRAKQVRIKIDKADWEPPHPPYYWDEVDQIATSIREDGWKGRPLLLVLSEQDYDTLNLSKGMSFTGSHRTAALRRVVDPERALKEQRYLVERYDNDPDMLRLRQHVMESEYFKRLRKVMREDHYKMFIEETLGFNFDSQWEWVRNAIENGTPDPIEVEVDFVWVLIDSSKVRNAVSTSVLLVLRRMESGGAISEEPLRRGPSR